jgi:hypothetical protein
VARHAVLAWRAWLAPAVALALLNGSVAFDNVWPTPRVTWGHALSLELAGCVLVLAVARRYAARLSRTVLPAAWLALVAGRYLDVTAPGLYGRDFNLYWDSRHLANVVSMIAGSTPGWLIVATVLAAVLAVTLVFRLARVTLGWVVRSMEHAPPRYAFGAAAVGVIALFGAQQLGASAPWMPPFADPVTGTYARQAKFVLAMMGPQAAAPPLGPSPALDGTLETLRGADVMIVFVESYGAVTYEAPTMAAALSASRADLADAVRETGRAVISAYVDSPTFGASSWLAHLSLVSGVEVRDQYAYTALMASDRETLVSNFSRRGYRTVALMPGMRQPWPEGAFYGFDVIYGRDALAYRGPRFGWWDVPDQFALARLDALERGRPDRQPLFVVFPTSASHAPFGPVAPYQPRWDRVLSDHPYDEGAISEAMAAAPDLTNLAPSYVRAVAYELTSFAGYLREHPDDPLVMILIGDHQPPAAVSGRGESWRVPVHVIAQDGAVLAALRRGGFRRGLKPEGPVVSPMHALVPQLLDAFSGPGPVHASLRDAPRQPRAADRKRQ